MNNFFQRLFTAGGFVAALLFSTYFGHLPFSVLFLLITVLGCWEFYGLVEISGNSPQKLTGTLVGAFTFILCYFVSEHQLAPGFLSLLLLPLFLVFIVELFRKKELPFHNIALTFLGIFYVALPFSLLHFILTITGTYTWQILFGCWFILWSNDTGAYLSGSAFGKNKLFPRVSPGKSWEGSIGGALAAFVVTFIISGWYSCISRFDWFILAAILIVIGTLGDLVESLFKRSLGVKDSGKILPGHGGILDRFDSLLMSIPFVFAYLIVMQAIK